MPQIDHSKQKCGNDSDDQQDKLVAILALFAGTLAFVLSIALLSRQRLFAILKGMLVFLLFKLKFLGPVL